MTLDLKPMMRSVLLLTTWLILKMTRLSVHKVLIWFLQKRWEANFFLQTFGISGRVWRTLALKRVRRIPMAWVDCSGSSSFLAQRWTLRVSPSYFSTQKIHWRLFCHQRGCSLHTRQSIYLEGSWPLKSWNPVLWNSPERREALARSL